MHEGYSQPAMQDQKFSLREMVYPQRVVASSSNLSHSTKARVAQRSAFEPLIAPKKKGRRCPMTLPPAERGAPPFGNAASNCSNKTSMPLAFWNASRNV
jgi:hypothetical protein